jgi:micrococcal nuclease
MKKSILFILLVSIFLSSCTTEIQTEEYQLEGPYKVVAVIDGDTADIIINGTTERLRFSGINTPETGECYYQEAKDELKRLILNKSVYIQRDISNKGNYGRLLRYIYINETLVNEHLVENGFARCYHKYKEDTSKYYQLARAEAYANQSELGLWSECNH